MNVIIMASIRGTKTDPANEHPLEHMVRQLETEIRGRTISHHMTPGTVTHVLQGHTILVMTHDRTATIPETVNRDGKIAKPKKIDMAIQNRIMTNHIRYVRDSASVGRPSISPSPLHDHYEYDHNFKTIFSVLSPY